MRKPLLLTVFLFGIVLGKFQVTVQSNRTLTIKEKKEVVGKVVYMKKSVDTEKEVELQCKFVTTASGLIKPVIWRKDDKLLQDGDEYKMRVTNQDKHHVGYLYILQPKPQSMGEYKCELSVSVGDEVTASGIVTGNPIILMPKETSIRVTEGVRKELACRFAVYPKGNIQVEWFRDNYSLPFTPGINVVLKDEKDADGKVVAKKNILIFESIKTEDKGVYFCKVSNGQDSDYLGWNIRVKSRLAFVWPLVGIILEVIVVVVIIVVYEVKKNKRRKEKRQAQEKLQFGEDDGPIGSTTSMSNTFPSNQSIQLSSLLGSYQSWAGQTDLERRQVERPRWIEGGHTMLQLPKRPNMTELIELQSSRVMSSSASHVDAKGMFQNCPTASDESRRSHWKVVSHHDPKARGAKYKRRRSNAKMARGKPSNMWPVACDPEDVLRTICTESNKA